MNLAMPFKKDSPFLYSFQKAMDKLRQDGVVNRVETEFKLALKLKELVDCDAGLVKELQSFISTEKSHLNRLFFFRW